MILEILTTAQVRGLRLRSGDLRRGLRGGVRLRRGGVGLRLDDRGLPLRGRLVRASLRHVQQHLQRERALRRERLRMRGVRFRRGLRND